MYKCCHPVELIKQNQSGKGRKRTSTEPGGGLVSRPSQTHIPKTLKRTFFYKIPNTNTLSTERIGIARTSLNHTKLIGCLQRSLRVYLENKRGESKSKITLRKAAASVIDPPSPTLREKNEKNSDD